LNTEIHDRFHKRIDLRLRSILWDKLLPGSWAPRDRKIVLDRILAENPGADSFESYISRTVSEFLRKRREKQKTIIAKEIKEHPDLENILSYAWRAINRKLRGVDIVFREDIMGEVLIAYIKAIRSGKKIYSLKKWINGTIKNIGNEFFKWKDQEEERRKEPEESSGYSDNDDTWDDDWLENKDVSKDLHSQYSDSFAFGQYPEAALDDLEFNQKVQEILGDKAPYYWAWERGVKVREQLNLLNAWTKYRAYLLPGYPMPKPISRNTIKKALETIRLDLGRRLDKSVYRSRKKVKKIGAKRPKI
jgi:hypothetical protein